LWWLGSSYIALDPPLDDNIGTESEPIYGSVVVGTECAGAATEDEKNKREN
jgi:hypothetical protein